MDRKLVNRESTLTQFSKVGYKTGINLHWIKLIVKITAKPLDNILCKTCKKEAQCVIKLTQKWSTSVTSPTFFTFRVKHAWISKIAYYYNNSYMKSSPGLLLLLFIFDFPKVVRPWAWLNPASTNSKGIDTVT